MLVSVDKRGSIGLPATVRKSLNLQAGSFLELSILEGGNIALSPVVVYPTVRLSEKGLAKLTEARQGGVDEMPDWLRKEMDNASIDTN
jgi:AbrB family looped-hinge helix DNA binding protein